MLAAGTPEGNDKYAVRVYCTWCLRIASRMVPYCPGGSAALRASEGLRAAALVEAWFASVTELLRGSVFRMREYSRLEPSGGERWVSPDQVSITFCRLFLASNRHSQDI